MTLTHRKPRYKSGTGGSQGGGGGGAGIKYHCDACQRDITDTVRVRCAVCADFDLCIECFRTGVEIREHSSDHAYRLLDRFAMPLLCPDWGADEEWLLMEAIQLYGLGNWADISEHLGTKTLEECRDHYIEYYINSPSYPLPDLSVELDATVVADERKKRRNSPKKPINVLPPLKPKVWPSHPANHEIQGYMPGRFEFDVEHENDAELAVKDLEFTDDDTALDIEMKLTLLDIYNTKLDRRQQRKDFITDRNLIDFKKVQANDKKRSREEKEHVQRTKPVARLLVAADYQKLIEGLAAEQSIRARIAQLQDYRRKGITTFQQADTYEQENKVRTQTLFSKSPFLGSSDRITKQRLQSHGSPGLQSVAMTPPPGNAPTSPPTSSNINSSNINNSPAALDLSGCEGVSHLTASEQALCSHLRLLPRAYLSIKQTILAEYARRGKLRRRQTRDLVRIDVNKLGKVYDFFVSKGWIRTASSK